MKHEGLIGFPKDQQFIRMSNVKQQSWCQSHNTIWAIIVKFGLNFVGFVVPVKFPTFVTRVRRVQANIKGITAKTIPCCHPQNMKPQNYHIYGI